MIIPPDRSAEEDAVVRRVRSGEGVQHFETVRIHKNGTGVDVAITASAIRDVGLSATRKYGDVKLTVGGAYSQENFYRATTGLMSVARDLANGNTTVAGGFSFSLNQPTLHPLPDRANQYERDGFASITQTLSKTIKPFAAARVSVGLPAGAFVLPRTLRPLRVFLALFAGFQTLQIVFEVVEKTHRPFPIR